MISFKWLNMLIYIKVVMVVHLLMLVWMIYIEDRQITTVSSVRIYALGYGYGTGMELKHDIYEILKHY